MQELKKCRKLLIEINQTCNLNCSYCFYRDYGRNKNSISNEDLNDILYNFPYVEEFYLTGGECFTSPEIEKIIKTLSDKGKVITFTNGVVLNSYDDLRLKNVVKNTDRFIISFDSFKTDDYPCRSKQNETLESIKRILKIDSNKVEVKVCVNEYNFEELDAVFSKLITLGVKYLSINFVFDIKNSSIKHEIKELRKLKEVFKTINKYKEYFNSDYIDMLYDLYINDQINKEFPCIADEEYFFIDCSNNYLICPGNCKGLGNRGEWEDCFSKECANEWEMMYKR